MVGAVLRRVRVEAEITTFSQSEFSRTMQSNGTGTDHAWGGQQIVIGGAVRGGIYGEMPTFALSGPVFCAFVSTAPRQRPSGLMGELGREVFLGIAQDFDDRAPVGFAQVCCF